MSIKKTLQTIEKNLFMEDIEKLKKIIELEKSDLTGLTKDWAAWTEAWLFMQDRNPNFIENNLTKEAFINNKVILIAYFDTKSRLKDGFEYNLDLDKLQRVDEKFWLPLLKKYISLKRDNKLKKEGITVIGFRDKNQILISIQPVLKSDFSGKVSGYLIMCRLITEDKLRLLKEIFGFSRIRIEKLNTIKEESSERMKVLQKGNYYEATVEIDNQGLTDNLLIRVDREIKLTSILQKYLFRMSGLYILSFLFLGIVFYFWLNRDVISRIKGLIKDLEEVKLGKRETLSIKDPNELGYLSYEINNYILTIKRQISEIEATRKLYETIAEQSESIIVVLDKEGHVIFANSQAKRLFNLEETKELEDLFLIFSELATINKGEKTFLPEFKLKDGSFLNLWLIPIEENKKILLIGYDITHFKKEKEKLLEKAIKDKLTKLYNRHYLEIYFRKILPKIKKGDIYCLIFIDLDDLKKINDKYGHLIGDKVLENFAITILKSIRQKDIAVRFGGDEFVLLINGDLEITKRIAERIQENLQKIEINLTSETIKPTASIGITIIDPSKDMETIIKEADKAAYDAKKYGKNRIKIFDAYE